MADIPAVVKIVERCQALFEDLDFTAVKAWKAAAPGRKAIGYMPVYGPRELIHAAGMLSVGVLGGGDQIEVIQGDAYYQSYICRIPRSTIELGLTGRLDCLEGMLFPSICDVIRNLSGMWQLLFKDKYVRYFDVPQNYVDSIGADEAKAIGLVHTVFDDPEAAALAYFDRQLADKSAASLAWAIAAARGGMIRDVRHRLAEVERLYLDRLMSTRDANEGLLAFLAKRKPNWEHR